MIKRQSIHGMTSTLIDIIASNYEHRIDEGTATDIGLALYFTSKSITGIKSLLRQHLIEEVFNA